MARSILFNVGNQLAYHVQLVIPGEDDPPLDHLPHTAVRLADVLARDLEADELLQNIQQLVLLQNLFPQVRGHIVAVLGGGVAGAAVLAGAVAALVKRQEISFFAVQLGGYGGVVQVDGKKRQHTAVQAEAIFARVAAVHPLHFGVVDTLAGQLVFQLQRHHRDTVDRQHHIHAVVVFVGVMPLADALADVLLVVAVRGGVQGGFRLEIADAEFHAAITEPVAQHRNQAIGVHRVLKGFIKFALRFHLALAHKPLPGDGLGALHKL